MKSSTAPTTADPELALRSALGAAALTAILLPSAIEAAKCVDSAALAAVTVELATTPIRIREVSGIVNPEERGWVQILLAVDDPGDVGSPRWVETLEALGSVIEAAVDAHPDLARSIASQISFDL